MNFYSDSFARCPATDKKTVLKFNEPPLTQRNPLTEIIHVSTDGFLLDNADGVSFNYLKTYSGYILKSSMVNMKSLGNQEEQIENQVHGDRMLTVVEG